MNNDRDLDHVPDEDALPTDRFQRGLIYLNITSFFKSQSHQKVSKIVDKWTSSVTATTILSERPRYTI